MLNQTDIETPEEDASEVVLDPGSLDPAEADITVDLGDGDGEGNEGMIAAATAEATTTDVVAPLRWDDNLIGDGPGRISETMANSIGMELLELYDQDLESRKDWEDRFARGLAVIGVGKDGGTKPFTGASEVVHPVLAEAMVQFNARSIAELFPPAGPVKGKVVGQSNPNVDDQRDRVETHMNWQYIEEMPEAFSEMDKLTLRVSYEGSSFKKVFFDPLLGRMRTIYVSGRDIVVPYSAQGLLQSPRVSHKYEVTHNDLLMYMEVGHWRKTDIQEPSITTETDKAQSKIAEAEGRSPPALGDGTHKIVEMQVYYDVEVDGLQRMGADGTATGIGRPFTVTMEEDSQVTLAIRRNWDEADRKETRQNNLVHYGFIPGFGFYYFGLLHWIGSLAEAATGTVRALLDSAAFANAQGGFKSKEARTAKGEVQLEPGRYKDIDLTSDELAKAFYTPPFKEPSPALFQLLGALTDYARRFSSTTEAMVGDANNNGPVGTTLALIEQGTKVFSAIHKRMHVAQMEEFRILAKLNFKHLPDSPTPIAWNGGTLEIMKSDYDGRVDVIPVSDPNLYSQTQRIALAQGVMQLAGADASGTLFDKRDANLFMLEAMGVPKTRIKTLMPDPDAQYVPLDPVSENQLLTMGKPVRAMPGQNHQAHNAVHKLFFQMLPPELQQKLKATFDTHEAEHVALGFRAGIAAHYAKLRPDLEAHLPIVNLYAKPGQPPAAPVDPQLDNIIASMVAEWMTEQAQANPQQPQEDPAMVEAKAKITRDDLLSQAQIKRDDIAAQADEKRKDAAAAREMARRDGKFKQDLDLSDGKAAADALRPHLQPEAAT